MLYKTSEDFILSLFNSTSLVSLSIISNFPIVVKLLTTVSVVVSSGISIVISPLFSFTAILYSCIFNFFSLFSITSFTFL